MGHDARKMGKINVLLGERRGSVLVMVLWVLTLLTMIVAYYSSQVRIMRNASCYLFDTTKGRMAAYSVLKMVAMHMSETVENATMLDDESAILPQVSYSTSVGTTQVDFVVENESGKIDLNKVKEDFLRGFMRFLIGEDDPIEADTITDGILDWRDKDKLARTNGAEDSIYNDKDPPYSAANGPFKTVDELRLINGVTDRLFYGPLEGPNIPDGWHGGLVDLFTVYGKGPEVNPDFAKSPIRAYMEESGLDGSQAKSTVWLLRAKVGQRIYKIYFTRLGGAPWYSVKFYTQGVGR